MFEKTLQDRKIADRQHHLQDFQWSIIRWASD